jgi:uncharacterized protein YkwD
MKRLWLLTLIPAILALFYFGTLIGSEKPVEPVKQPDISSQKPNPPTVEEIYRLVNEERAKVGVAPLKLDPRLNQSAQEKADELAREGWDDTPHLSDSGVHGWQIAAKYAPECVYTGENLTISYSSKNAVQSWLDSKDHKQAMLSERNTHTGLALSKMTGTYYTVQHFCQQN